MFNKINKINALLIIAILLLNIFFSPLLTQKVCAEDSTTDIKGPMLVHAKYNEYGPNPPEKISNASGGAPGDQRQEQNCGITEEVAIEPFYDKPWLKMLRYNNSDKKLTEKVKKAIADNAIKAARNVNIGYDQPTRRTFYQEAVKAGYDIAAINTPCAADCSALVAGILGIVGHELNIPELQEIANLSPITANMESVYKSKGFTVYDSSNINLKTAESLQAGDILLIPRCSYSNIRRGSFC